jgi:Mrp family chromosome partitioning ATPase
MQKLLLEMAEKYDYIIVDLPHVNAVADPLAISKYIDGMIVVVRHGVSRRKEVMEAIRRLKLVNAKIFGFVYNGTYKGTSTRA